MAGAELPGVIINMMRGGPGLGGIQPAQSDYNMCVKGGGNGDYHSIVIAPATVQEAVELTVKAFDLADEYRNPVIILGDGIIGQMMEPVDFDKIKTLEPKPKTWAANGTANKRKPNIINSLILEAEGLEQHNIEMFKKYEVIENKEQMSESYKVDDADLIFVAYGTTARICRNVVDEFRAKGIKAGLFRPISLYPFPVKALRNIPEGKKLLVVEMSMGQMVNDVKLFGECKYDVHFYGRTGGVIPTTTEIYEAAAKILGGE